MTKIKKGSAPLYLSYVDTINGMLGSMTFDPELPPHKKAIDRSGRNVEWLRKAFKRGTMSTHPDFIKLTQLLEVPFQDMTGTVESGRIAGKGPNPSYEVNRTNVEQMITKADEVIIGINRQREQLPSGTLTIPVDMSNLELNAGLTSDQVNKFSQGSFDQQNARAKRQPSKNPLFAERYGQQRRPGQPEPILTATTSASKSVARQVIDQLDNLPDGEYKLVDGKIVREGA